MNKNYVVTKSNDLINARYDLSIDQHRIVLMMISLIQPDDEDFKEYELDIKQFAEMIDVRVDGKYQDVYDATKKMTETSFEIGFGKRVIVGSWLPSADYDFGKGKVKIALNPKLKPYLLELKRQFTSYQLKYALLLTNSKYSVRMYEMFKMSNFKGNFVISVDDLKYKLKLDKYRFSDLKLRVIDPAVREVNEKTDLFVEWKPIKKGRKVESISFRVLKNPRVEFQECAK